MQISTFQSKKKTSQQEDDSFNIRNKISGAAAIEIYLLTSKEAANISTRVQRYDQIDILKAREDSLEKHKSALGLSMAFLDKIANSKDRAETLLKNRKNDVTTLLKKLKLKDQIINAPICKAYIKNKGFRFMGALFLKMSKK